MTRKYSSISVEQLLDSPMGAADTTLELEDSAAVTALLGGVTLAAGDVDQFTIAVDPDTASEEVIFVRNTSGAQLTSLLRGQAGTSATTHTSGATVKHVLTSNDLDFYTTGVATADAAVTLTGTQTLTNKTIALGSNTISGTTAQFNTALTDGSFATLAGTETLTNKTLTAPVVSSISNTGTLTLPTSTDTLVGRATTDTLTNKTITTPVISIGLNAQTTAYTLQATDKNKLVTITSASAANFTVPSGVFSAGDVVYIARLGTGTVAATASGTTINGTPGLNLRAQYSTSAIICTASNTFLLVGDLAA